jgi:chaperonin cofactor prefoldin
MGLDMYLTKRHYVKNWNFMGDEEKHQVTVKKNNKARKDIDSSKITGIIEDVMYWRKANEIHSWFVNNVQDGNDNCQESYVSQEQLRELLKDINDVLLDHNKADDLLPTQGGFFFGGTEYNESYFQELEETKTMLEKELTTEGNQADYYYRASW